MKELGIVICNFNKVDYLKGCLETLYKSNFKNLSYEVIVVDNASTDGSSEFVKNNYPQVVLLQNEINTGGSGGFDRGIRFALEKQYQYIALLDNDILLEKNTLINLVKYIKSNPIVGVVGSKICTMDNPDILQEMGSFIDIEKKFNVVTPLKGHKDDASLPEAVVCDYVPACCLVTTKKVLQKVGSFNTDHFIYWDDMDWCTRVKRAGYEIHAINASRVFHKMGAANHANTFGVYYFQRNRIMYYLKYLPEKNLAKFKEAICDWLLTVTFFSNLKGNYATPKSILFALDDLLANELGKQDKSIFTKEEEINIFEKYKISKDEKAVLYMQGDMITNRRVFLFLQEYFGRNLQITCDEQNYEVVRQNFDQTLLIKPREFQKQTIDRVFYALEHILSCTKTTPRNANYFYIDQYLNTANPREMTNILDSYAMYEDMFDNIYRPAYKNTLSMIRKKISRAKGKE